MPKPIKNFFWPITDECTRVQLELFVHLSIVRGTHHNIVLAELVKNYNKSFIKKRRFLHGVKLTDEKQLLRQLAQAGTPISRVALLRKYREKRLLVNGAVPLFWTDGKRVVYNLRGCKEFFRQRAQ